MKDDQSADDLGYIIIDSINSYADIKTDLSKPEDFQRNDALQISKGISLSKKERCRLPRKLAMTNKQPPGRAAAVMKSIACFILEQLLFHLPENSTPRLFQDLFPLLCLENTYLRDVLK